jgi:ATP-binding cassette subfamily F protein uup
LVGPSGSGKSTLLGLLAGTLCPDAGRIERADGLRVIGFDQQRAVLEPEVPLRRALSPEGDSVVFRDRPVHVSSWARRFLFQPEQLSVAVGRLSGGERARILIARLMLQPADVLLLDEPTNDLDIPTLEVLEDNLDDFPGALVLVTRDRFLLDRLTTAVLALDRDGRGTFFADYAQWELAREEAAKAARAARVEAGGDGSTANRASRDSRSVKRLSYLEKREWESMEQRIVDAEAALGAANEAMNDPAVASDPATLDARYRTQLQAKAEVDRLYGRWAELEAKQG